jgi:hypothetical protein
MKRVRMHVQMNNNKGNVVVPLFQSFEQMRAEEQAALEEYARENERLFAKYDAVLAVVADDEPVLAKFANGDVDLAKAFVRLHGDRAKSEVAYQTGVALLAAVKRRNDRIYGVSDLAKRGRRFAAAVSRRYQGPASDVTSIESRR